LVDQNSDRQSRDAVKGFQHRQADEGCIAEASHQDQATGRGGREPHYLRHRPEEQHGDGEQQPWHRHRIGECRVGFDAVDLQQCKRRKGDVDDEAVDGCMGIFGDTAIAPQRHSDQHANKQQGNVTHGRYSRGTSGESRRATQNNFVRDNAMAAAYPRRTDPA
jgi:hypothetical protein